MLGLAVRSFGLLCDAAVAAGTATLVGTDPQQIVNHIFALLDDDRAHAAMARAHNPYGDGQAAQRIARIVEDAHRR